MFAEQGQSFEEWCNERQHEYEALDKVYGDFNSSGDVVRLFSLVSALIKKYGVDRLIKIFERLLKI